MRPRQEVAPQQQRSRESHERILGAAERILGGAGIVDFSLPRVSEESGVSIGGIYGRFEDKEALLLAVQRRVYEKMTAEHARLEAAAQAYEAQLDTYVGIYVAGIAQILKRHAPLIKAIVEASWGNPAVGREGVRTYAEQRQRFVDLVLSKHRASITHPDPRHALAFCFSFVYELVASHFGFGRRVSTDHSRWETLVSDLQQLCISYLTNPAPPAAPLAVPQRLLSGD